MLTTNLVMPLEQLNIRDNTLSSNLHIFEDVSSYTKKQHLSHYQELNLASVIQPIYSIDHQRTIGYEALVRATTAKGEKIPPLTLLDMPENEQEAIYLDRLCRFTHMANFHQIINDNCWLFINISALVSEKGRKDGPFFAELLKKFNIKASNVVVEIIEDEATDRNQLLDSINYYKEMGCMIAIDDFGAGHSNFERVWSLQPDIVKLDRSMILRAIESETTQQMLNSIVQLLHQANCLVVIEGVENEQQALTAMSSGADFIQGFFFAKPQRFQQIDFDKSAIFNQLSSKFIAVEQRKITQENQQDEKYVSSFKQCILNIQQGESFIKATSDFNLLTGTKRCYLLDHIGDQIEKTILFNKEQGKSKFSQLQESEKANWYRKSYVIQAIKKHSRICISEPYRSITGDVMCITLSMSFNVQNKQQILCLDINRSNFT
ncbi:MAG: EAL domain-containing protein [Colwellia sp.]|nr:EAL domain-containing protein [Colwellia sp.]